jgi:hypothetical protein
MKPFSIVQLLGNISTDLGFLQACPGDVIISGKISGDEVSLTWVDPQGVPYQGHWVPLTSVEVVEGTLHERMTVQAFRVYLNR